MTAKEKLVWFAIGSASGFVGGLMNEMIMRQAYLARLRSQGVEWETAPPPVTFPVWISLTENAVGVGVGLGLSALGIALEGTPGKILTLLGAGALGYTGGKMVRDVHLPQIIEKR